MRWKVWETGSGFSANNVIKFLGKEGRIISTETLYSYINVLCKALI